MTQGRARARLAVALLGVFAILGACGSDAAATRDGASASPAAPAGSAPASGSDPAAPSTSAASSSAGSSSATPSGSAAGVVRDDSLLALLPASLDGVPVTAEDQSFAEAAADPAFSANVERAAFPIVTSGSNLAAGVVAKLRDGIYSTTFFRDWRDTYDQGACAQAGGVATTAETAMDGRPVHITTCTGGLRVYHTWLPDHGVIVSLFSLGDARYGEQLMARLGP